MTSTITPAAPTDGRHGETSGSGAQVLGDSDRWTESEAAAAEDPSRGSARWAAALAPAPPGPLWSRTWFIALCVLLLLAILNAVIGGGSENRAITHHGRVAHRSAHSDLGL